MGILNSWLNEILADKKVEKATPKIDFADFINETKEDLPETQMVPVLIIRQYHLRKESIGISFDEISYNDVKGGIFNMQKASIVMFVSDKGYTRILKNRFGSEGLVNNKK